MEELNSKKLEIETEAAEQVAVAEEKAPREVVISFEHVKKEFRYYRSNRQKMRNILLGMNSGELINVLDDVSFEIHKGEKVAIIGTIASGRSTIMRLIAGIFKPTAGVITVKEEPTLIFDHKYAFKASLTGRENLRLRANLLGWSKEKLAAVEEDIIEFADLTGVIDNRVKTLPTGSMARVGLGLMTAYKPDILLYDEFFNFGGRRYLPRCLERIRSVLDEDTTLIMTVGNVPFVKKFCTIFHYR